MSGPDQGDEDKGFLARWSQRKQEAKQPEPKPDEPAAEAPKPGAAPVAETEAEPEFDLSSLPKLEELTATTDITGVSPQGRARTSAQCGAAKILGAGPRDPQLRQSRARIRL